MHEVRHWRGETYRLARAAFYGAVLASVCYTLVSALTLRTFPGPLYYIPIMGGTGGAVWHLLDRVPLTGRGWWYCRWVIVTFVGYMCILLPSMFSERPAISELLGILGIVVASGISLAHYAERLRRKKTTESK